MSGEHVSGAGRVRPVRGLDTCESGGDWEAGLGQPGDWASPGQGGPEGADEGMKVSVEIALPLHHPMQ